MQSYLYFLFLFSCLLLTIFSYAFARGQDWGQSWGQAGDIIDFCCLTAKLQKTIETNADMLKKLHK